MVLGKVIGNVWATKKDDSLNGYKLMVVNMISAEGEQKEEEIVAVDTIGAGVGDTVLISKGNASRVSENGTIQAPIDARIVGIVDQIDA